MQIPLEISFRDGVKTNNLESLIREQVDKLERVCDYITSCQVAVEKPHKHMKSGSPYRVRIVINVPPSQKIVVKREPGDGDMHDDIATILRGSFDAAKRQLQKVVEQQRGETKEHPQQQMQAVVDKLFPDDGYGFLKTIDNRNIYFHKNSVVQDDFDRLELGTGVRFVEELGQKGPQATSVTIVNKPGSRISEQDSEG